MAELPSMPAKSSSVELPLLPKMPKKKDATALSGQESSTVGKSNVEPTEDDSWAITKNLKGLGKAIYNKAIEGFEGFLRANVASGSMGSGAPSQFLAQEIKGEKPKQLTYKQRVEEFDKTMLPALESAKFEKKGDSRIFTENGLRVPDAEAVGYQIGDGIAQLGLNMAGGGVGLAINFFASTENNYQDARSKGIPADRALTEGAVLAGGESLMDRFLGVESVLGKKTIGKAAVSQIAKERLTKEAFDKTIAQSVSALSKEALKKTAKGAGFEAIDEGFQNFSSEGVKSLFDIYQKAKKEDNPNAKIELYDADAFSKKTLVGSLNSGFYGGLSAGIGSSFTSSKAFTPTVYSSMQNAYDAGGVQELANSKAIVEKGINQALQEKKMTPQEHQVALTNLNNIASDVQSYSQNSKADSYTRFQKFDIENNQIPNASARVAESFVEQLAPTIQANESDVQNDIEVGNLTELQFDSRENTPDEFIPYLTDEKVVINGNEVVQAKVPNSIVQASEQSRQGKANAIQVVSQAIGESTKSSGGVSFEGLLSRIQTAFGDAKSKEAIALEATSKKKDITKDLRLINFLTESKNELTKNGSLDVSKSQQGYENWLKANEGTEVEYQGNTHTIEDVSHNAQQVKLSRVDGFVNTSDVAIAKKETAPTALQTAEEATQEGINALANVESTTKALDDKSIEKIKTPKDVVPIYHYSSSPNLKLENKNTWFTESSSYPLRGDKSKIEVFINPKELKLASEKEVFSKGNGDFNKGVDVLKSEGYDGVKTKNYGANEYLIFNIDKTKNKQKAISEAYHKAKEDGSNPELVNAVEEVLLNKEQPTTQQEENVNPLADIKPENAEKVYHGADIDFTIEGKSNRIMFTSKNKDYANYYAKQRNGKVFEFDIDSSKIAKEQYVKDKIQELDLKTEDGELPDIDDNLHRLIDPRFDDTAISKDGLDLLFSELEKEGYYGIDFMDENQDMGGRNEVEATAIFNPKELLKPVKQATKNQPTQPQQIDGQQAEQPTGQEKITSSSDAVQQVTPAEAPKTKATKIEKPKGRIHERALEVEDSSPMALAIKYFASGGKVMKDVPAGNTGAKLRTLASLFTKKGQTSKAEMNSRRSISATKEQGGLTIDAIAHKLWEENGGDTQDYADAVEDILNRFSTKTQMSEHLLELNNQGGDKRISGMSEYETAAMEFSAREMGMSLEEFLDYLDNNPDARDAADLTLEEIENALQDESIYNELVNGLELTPEERAELDEVFAESISREQSVEPPIVPPAPPSDTNQEDIADNPENKPVSEEDDLSLTILSREESKRMAEDKKKGTMTTWNKIVEALAESDVAIRKALERAAGKDSFVVALLRNRRGLTAAITQDLQKLDEKIFKGLNEIGLDRFDTLVYAYNTIQKDERRDKQRNREVQNLIEQYKEKNEGVFPDAKSLESIKDKALKAYPQLNHGTVKIPINGKLKEVPMTSEIAKDKIAKIEKALGEEFPKMKQRVDDFKKVGNDMLKKEYDKGTISKEVYEDMKDDFYAMRMTIERAFEQMNSSDRIAYKPVLDDVFGSLSKDGTTKAMITNSRLLMQVAYSKMEQAIKRNELKAEIYKATVAQGKEQDLFKEAKVVTIKDKQGNVTVVQDEKGDVLSKNIPKGFKVVGFKENGRAKYFLMNEELYNQLYNLNSMFSEKVIDIAVIRELSNIGSFGNRILTGFATRYNPLFFASNASMDMTQQIIFSDIWDEGKTYSNLASTTLKALSRSAKFLDIAGRHKKEIQALKERAIELGLGMDMMSLTSETKKQYIEEGAVTPILEADKDGKVKKAAKWLSQLNPRVEWAMRLAAFDEVRNRLTSDFENKNNRKPNEQEQYEIDTIAVSKARAYTDFAEKGTVTPALNVAYLTSSIAAFSSTMKYATSNPKALAFKVAQMATAGFVYHLASLVVMGLIGEPEDYLNIKEYDKRKNILTPIAFKVVKDKYGKDKIEYAFAPIRVNPSASPIWSASRMAAEETYAKIMGIKTKETSTVDKIETFIDLINEPLPITIPLGLSKETTARRAGAFVSRGLFFSAGVKAFTAYDPYRGEDMLTYDDRRGELGAEGMKNKNIPFIYKKFGEVTGLSPVRTKAVVETFTTSGHPAVQLAYAVSSEVAAALSKKETATIRGESGFTNIAMMKKLVKDLAGRRLIITSDVNYAYNKEIEENYKKAENISRKYLTQELKLRIELNDLRKESKNEADFLNKVETQVIPKFKKENKDIFGEFDILDEAYKIADKSTTKALFEPSQYDDAAVIKITQTPKGQADMLYYMYGDDVKKAEQTLDKASFLGLKDPFRVLDEYKELVKSQKKK